MQFCFAHSRCGGVFYSKILIVVLFVTPQILGQYNLRMNILDWCILNLKRFAPEVNRSLRLTSTKHPSPCLYFCMGEVDYLRSYIPQAGGTASGYPHHSLQATYSGSLFPKIFYTNKDRSKSWLHFGSGRHIGEFKPKTFTKYSHH